MGLVSSCQGYGNGPAREPARGTLAGSVDQLRCEDATGEILADQTVVREWLRPNTGCSRPLMTSIGPDCVAKSTV